MNYSDRLRTISFYYEEMVAVLRNYIKQVRPQSFAMCWMCFKRLYADMKAYGASTGDVRDLFDYAQNEHISRFGVDETEYSFC